MTYEVEFSTATLIDHAAIQYAQWITHGIVADLVYWQSLVAKLYELKCIGESIRELAKEWDAAFPDQKPGTSEPLLADLFLGFKPYQRVLGGSRIRRDHRMTYPKRLIEVDLPIARISAHARREKSIRHGHISTLHIWWARRPLAACRAVICAALWPDPADPLCPRRLPGNGAKAHEHVGGRPGQELPGSREFPRDSSRSQQKPKLLDDNPTLCARRCSTSSLTSPIGTTPPSRAYLDTSRALTQAAHEALGGAPGTRPLVVDPFAGGGSIPLEALRVGADAFASDLNPVPVLLNKVVLEYIPKYGQRLADEVRKWGEWIKREAEKELAEFYPKDADGATPIAYLWARTVLCEGPAAGTRKCRLSAHCGLPIKPNRLRALRWVR